MFYLVGEPVAPPHLIQMTQTLSESTRKNLHNVHQTVTERVVDATLRSQRIPLLKADISAYNKGIDNEQIQVENETTAQSVQQEPFASCN